MLAYTKVQNCRTFGTSPELKKVAVSLEGKIALLENTRWTLGLSYRQVRELASYMEVLECESGATIFEEGQRQPFMTLIVSGVVQIQKFDSSNQPQIIARLRSGHTIGEMALLDGEPRSASVVALKKVTLLGLRRVRFASMLAQSPELTVQLLLRVSRMLSRRLRLTSGALVEHLECPSGETLPPPTAHIDPTVPPPRAYARVRRSPAY